MSTKQANDIKCLDNAKPDEPVFVLRAQDILAPELVREWAYRALNLGTNHDKVDEARRCADAMEDWQIKNQRKVPD